MSKRVKLVSPKNKSAFVSTVQQKKACRKHNAIPVLEEKRERIAKVIARAGLCSRRNAERLIDERRVRVNDKVLESAAFTVSLSDRIIVDDTPLQARAPTRLWLYNKPRGLVTTNNDPQGRPTIFDNIPDSLPRVMSIGRLDINTEGLMLLTNDGGLARILELPETGWLRRYRVRAYCRDQKQGVTQEALDALADGVVIDGMIYGSIDAKIDQDKGTNLWLSVALREGKNQEVKKIMSHLGVDVNRLIRISYGPFQLLDLEVGAVQEVRRHVLRDQLGPRLIEAAGADFEPRESQPNPNAAGITRKEKVTPKNRKPKKIHWSEEKLLDRRKGRSLKAAHTKKKRQWGPDADRGR